MYEVIGPEVAGQTQLAYAPASIWIISTIEIALEQNGRTAMLLGYPSYPLSNQRVSDDHDEGYWAPPFVAIPVPLGYSPPTTVASGRELVARSLAEVDVKRDLAQLAYSMGLRDVVFQDREAFLELKISPRSPDLLKAYFVLRHGLVSVDPNSLRSLTDSEVRRGYVFCPTDLPSDRCFPRESETHGRTETWFLGKPLQSNIEVVLRDPARASKINAHAIKVSSEHFVRRETGIVASFDLAGYGHALQYAGSAMHAFGIDGSAAQERFRSEVSRILQRLLFATGTTQAQLAGDGLVAAFPDRVFPDRLRLMDLILSAWEQVLNDLEALSNDIRQEDRRPGSRAAFVHGSYSFGRVAGMESFIPAFDGEDLVTAVRMEQGLSLLIAEEAERPLHSLALSLDLDVALSDSIAERGWKHIGVRTLTAKEFAGEASVYHRTEST